MDRKILSKIRDMYGRCVRADHAASDYFCLLRGLVGMRENAAEPATVRSMQEQIDRVYALVEEEIRSRTAPPASPVSFGTSGWRGILGKDICIFTVTAVTEAIVSLYQDLDTGVLSNEVRTALGVKTFAEARRRGCVLGHDNRFGGPLLAGHIASLLTDRGFTVHMAGEATTGALSAALLEIGAAFSINLTPSHNPLEYGGFKFNAADGGPAPATVTDCITQRSRRLVQGGAKGQVTVKSAPHPALHPVDALSVWQAYVRKNREQHGIDYDGIIAKCVKTADLVVAIDCIHGAARRDVKRLLGGEQGVQNRLFLRDTDDPTFGGVAPEPSSENMGDVVRVLRSRPEPLKLGAIIDPDGDRIRFTDGQMEISMNHFGAMAYHYLHEHKNRKGPVAKTVATSNFANAIAEALGEDVFEPAVGFKNFQPVLGKALVCFEESDGMTVIGHTPEKDAFVGLLLALDMVLTLGKNLGQYLGDLEKKYGSFYPARDGIPVAARGEELVEKLHHLDKYSVGTMLAVGDATRVIRRVITVDGRKFILDDGSWLMIRPSGTEPKVRLYVEARTPSCRNDLFATARTLLKECGV